MSTGQDTAWWTAEPIGRWWATWDSDEMYGAGHVYAPATVEIVVENWRGYDVALTAKATPQGFACAHIAIGERDRPVDYDALRSVPITELLRPALESLFYVIPPSVLHVWKPGTKPGEIDLEFMKDKDARMTYTAGVYDLAQFAGMGPREAVQDYFGVSRATSTRLVATARKAGIISDSPPDRLHRAPGEVLEMIAGGTATAGNPPERLA